jgi:hypothetical protein
VGIRESGNVLPSLQSGTGPHRPFSLDDEGRNPTEPSHHDALGHNRHVPSRRFEKNASHGDVSKANRHVTSRRFVQKASQLHATAVCESVAMPTPAAISTPRKTRTVAAGTVDGALVRPRALRHRCLDPDSAYRARSFPHAPSSSTGTVAPQHRMDHASDSQRDRDVSVHRR